MITFKKCIKNINNLLIIDNNDKKYDIIDIKYQNNLVILKVSRYDKKQYKNFEIFINLIIIIVIKSNNYIWKCKTNKNNFKCYNKL